MASIQLRGGRWQLRVKHRLLPSAFFHTFDTEAAAREYGAQLEALLVRGIVPLELAEAQKRGSNPLLGTVIAQYKTLANVAPSDRATLDLIGRANAHIRVQAVNAAWADLWVAGMRAGQKLAPGTIRKRVECLARALDWYWRRAGEVVANPLRNMPRGYASATADEVHAAKSAGRTVPRDTQRNRRLDDAELARIRAALAGTKAPGKQRALPSDAGFALLFELILGTGLRLSEAYSLRVDQVDLARWVLNVEGSKGHRGAARPRMVPLVRRLRVPLQAWCRDRVGRVFDFWDGTPADKPRCTMRLSARFATLFAYAGVPDFTEHDLRHCATCDWVTMRDAAGRWVFGEVELCKIMGWTDTRMMLRYASLRGEDLAARLG